MRRNSTEIPSGYIQKLRDNILGVIRTTLLSGFPGESEEDFDEPRICKEAKTRLGVFYFSWMKRALYLIDSMEKAARS